MMIEWKSISSTDTVQLGDQYCDNNTGKWKYIIKEHVGVLIDHMPYFSYRRPVEEISIEEWLRKEWPLKPHEGSIGVQFSCGKYLATIKYFVFDKNGRGGPLTDWADGYTPGEAFLKLWESAILTVIELKQSNRLPVQLADWACRFLDDGKEDRP